MCNIYYIYYTGEVLNSRFTHVGTAINRCSCPRFNIEVFKKKITFFKIYFYDNNYHY